MVSSPNKKLENPKAKHIIVISLMQTVITVTGEDKVATLTGHYKNLETLLEVDGNSWKYQIKNSWLGKVETVVVEHGERRLGCYLEIEGLCYRELLKAGITKWRDSWKGNSIEISEAKSCTL